MHPETPHTQAQRLDRLLEMLDAPGRPPTDIAGKRQWLRALMNLHPGEGLPPDFFALQDEELRAQSVERGRVEVAGIPPSPLSPGLRLWKGDITRIAADAIVNAANAQLLGCFRPLHNCIDNVIHSAAGLQLRAACRRLMEAQGHEEPVGRARITPAYNLPATWVLHTVGPAIEGDAPTPGQCSQLAGCYAACLDLALQRGLRSVAFCCISTGVFRFPQARAAKIAVETVRPFVERTPGLTVIFDVFTDTDETLYRRLLGY